MTDKKYKRARGLLTIETMEYIAKRKTLKPKTVN